MLTTITEILSSGTKKVLDKSSSRCYNSIKDKTKKEVNKMKKLVLNVITIACVIWLGWLAWSFVDVVSDNNTGNPTHADTNAFVVLVD